MLKLPTVKVNGQTAFVINRHQVEDDVAVAEAISRDSARYRWLRDNIRLIPSCYSPKDIDEFVDIQIK